ncbi:cupin domain-containing protein [Novosphingobium mathurense]|uniref:Predicted enzyme of the cupin superfamily n=1 Tax=Novosphingobium mathurense TaxID=428990 RepID=A0A1U6HX26_9SPHN|nr:cupin domain-containing protein [Novosphingobium mathurense]SLK00266.1 Predicted enzyme of the cupin superfamily [Novosphingobium mathurense]
MNTLTGCPTFIDLRAMAANLPAAGNDDADPFTSGAHLVDIRSGPCEVGLFALAAGKGETREDRGDTWVFVLEGAVTLADATGSLDLAAGESCGVARGTAFTWSCSAPAKLLFMRYLEGNPGTPGISPIANDAALSPSNPPAAELLLGETPSCRSNTMFASADEAFKCGVWDSTPYQRKPIFFHHCELMHLLAGSVTFVDADGRESTFSKGDTFIIEQGAECSWDSQVDVAKIFALWRKPA